ncbi:MAG: hypothetical protein C5B44_05735 [Acidobacteria bacterium]|nr:MAG: hypothetical protein C5B44_05735 [Acidobacteriota bacterium]
MRQFESGATRDSDVEKFDYEGFFSPLVLERRARYMHKHRKQADGKLRDSDNWQRGIPLTAYMKSGFRHFHDWWRFHRTFVLSGKPVSNFCFDLIEDSICALMFNCEGYLHELLKKRYEANGAVFWKATDEVPHEAVHGG